MKWKFVFLCFILLSTVSCKRNENISKAGNSEYAKEALKNALNNKDRQLLVDTIISNSKINYKSTVIADKDSAIRYAENILFKVYTKEQILQGRPYNINLENGYWVISGTMQDAELGGVFLIVINSQNGKVIEMIHGK